MRPIRLVLHTCLAEGTYSCVTWRFNSTIIIIISLIKPRANNYTHVRLPAVHGHMQQWSAWLNPGVTTVEYLISTDVDLRRKPMTCGTERSSNVASLHHLHQVSDDLCSRSNTQTRTDIHTLAPRTPSIVAALNQTRCRTTKHTIQVHFRGENTRLTKRCLVLEEKKQFETSAISAPFMGSIKEKRPAPSLNVQPC